MKILVLISLLVPAIVAIIQYFLSKEKRKVQIILATLTLIGVGLAYFLTMNDAAENEKLKQASARSESLLKNANDQLSKQSEELSRGFGALSTQLNMEGSDNAVILEQVKNLQNQVTDFANSSKDFNLQALALLQKEETGGTPPVKQEEKGLLSIPQGDKNARTIDGKNQLAVVSDQPDMRSRNSIFITFNGRKRVEPAEKVKFKNEKGTWSTLVYIGLVNDNFVFRIETD